MPHRHAASGQRSPASDQAQREMLLTEVATLYYVDRFTQQQIARQIGRSVATVSRLLSEAEAKDIVEVRVRYPIPVVPELQAALVERFGLRLARVVRTSPDESHGTLLSKLGALAAHHLTTLLADGSVVSVGWGTSISEVVRAVKSGPHRGIRIVQGLGSLGSQLPAIDNPLITQVLAERVNGTPHFLPAPMVVESTAIRDALARDPQFRETYNLCQQSDIALVGIGLIEPDYSGLYRAGYVDSWILERIRADGAIGDIMVEFFDIYGRIHDTEIDTRVMGMRQAELRRAGTVLAVAGGVVKAPAILGALRTGLIHVLVIDSATARRVIELDDATRAGPPSDDARDEPAPRLEKSQRDAELEVRAVLAATVALLEDGGSRDLTIEAVAARAGVAMATIHRRWSSKADLVMEAYITTAEQCPRPGDTGDLREDLQEVLAPIFGPNADWESWLAAANEPMRAKSRPVRELEPACLEFDREWRGALCDALERGKARSELSTDADSDTLADMILGMTWYRALLERTPLDATYVRKIIELVIAGNRPRGFISTERSDAFPASILCESDRLAN